MKLITLEQASDYIRRDTSDDDMTLDLLIDVASSLILDYLGQGADSWLDSNGDLVLDSNGNDEIPNAVKGATLYMTAWLYRNRDEDAAKACDTGSLPGPVASMLYRLRDPALS